jgi:chromosome segregation ATPase
MHTGRKADSQRRRERVERALHDTAARGEEINASAIARAAQVDRSFLYRHPDLLAQIHSAQTRPAPTGSDPTTASRASLHAELLASQHRTARLNSRIQQLEKRLSQTLGQQAWQASGLGAPDDIETLTQKITHLEQQILDVRLQLEERDQDLAAARAANRELMAQFNGARPLK